MDGETRKVKESGVFFDVLKEELNKENITVKIFDWDIPENDDRRSAQLILEAMQEAVDRIRNDIENGKYDNY